MSGTVYEPKDLSDFIRSLTKKGRGKMTSIAKEKGISQPTLSSRTKTLRQKVMKVTQDLESFFRDYGQEKTVKYLVETKEGNEDNEKQVKEMEKTLKQCILNFLRKENPQDVEQFEDAFRYKYAVHCKWGLSLLARKLNLIRKATGYKIDEFCQKVAPFVKNERGEIYEFRWLFNSKGESQAFSDFIGRVLDAFDGPPALREELKRIEAEEQRLREEKKKLVNEKGIAMTEDEFVKEVRRISRGIAVEYTEEQVLEVLEWARGNPWWCTRVTTPSKFDRYFGTMLSQKEEAKAKEEKAKLREAKRLDKEGKVLVNGEVMTKDEAFWSSYDWLKD